MPSRQLIKLPGGLSCLRTHSTTGFGIEINFIWIQSDSLLHSLQWFGGVVFSGRHGFTVRAR